MFSLIYTWTNGSVNNRYADDLIRHRDHYDVTVLFVIVENPQGFNYNPEQKVDFVTGYFENVSNKKL